MYRKGQGVAKDYTKALEWYLKAAEAGNSTAMNNIGWMYQKVQGFPKDYTKALEWYLKAAEAGNSSAMNNIGRMYQEGEGVTKDSSKAPEWYRKAAEAGNSSAMYNLGWMYGKGQGVPKDYTKALEWYRKAAEGGDVSSMLEIGDMYKEGKGVPHDAQKAVRWYEKAAKLGNNKAKCNVASHRGEKFRLEGRYVEASAEYEKAVKLAKEIYGLDNSKTVRLINNLAAVYYYQGKYADAERYFKQTLVVRKEALDPEHPDIATAFNNLAALYYSQGRYDEAEPLFKQALTIEEKIFGKEDIKITVNLYNLGMLYLTQGRYVEAGRLLRHALEIKEENLPPDHPDIAASIWSLGRLCWAMGKYDEAEPLLRRALEVEKKALGEDHPAIIPRLQNLAALYDLIGKYFEAEQLYMEVMAIGQKALRPNHPHMSKSLAGLGVHHALVENWSESIKCTKRARRIIHRHISDVLPSLSESQQLAFIRTQDESFFHTALSLGLIQNKNREAVEASAEWLLNGKALIGEVLSERTQLGLQNEDPQICKVVEQLVSVRSQLATLIMKSPLDGNYRRNLERTAELTTSEQELSKKLSELTGRGYYEDTWVPLDELRGSIRNSIVLVNIAKFDVYSFGDIWFDFFGFQAKILGHVWRPAHYAAWIIPAADEGEVKLIDLGEAEPIEKAIKEFRHLMRSLNRNELANEAIAEKKARDRLRTLSNLVLSPIEPYISKVNRWLISPDGALWLIPWGALQLQDGSYAIEKYSISYLISGRDLVTKSSKVKSKRCLVMADPDYNLPINQVKVETNQILQSRQLALATSRSVKVMSENIRMSKDIRRQTWGRLKNTAKEAKVILPKLKAYAKNEPLLYMDKQALEGVFKASESPKVVVLSTHGFFLEDQDYENVPNAKTNRDRGIFIAPKPKPQTLKSQPVHVENSLLRCGLVLAGANNRSQALDGNDGILTGLEIVGTDLRGTELVVLSACETGVGDVINGEGVAGLRQAFQLAGAESVVSTLWKIPDKETTDLMVKFFEGLAAGKSKVDALREAQLSMIDHRRQQYNAAHPLYWASFTLTGAAIN